MSNNRVLIIAGEASGDLHGGNLARALLALRPGLSLSGIGGANMRAAGVDTLVDASSIAVVGIMEVLAHIKEIKGAFDKIKRILQNDPPALIVLIDYPDFNLRMAKVAKDAGVPVVYYISPQVWAWRKGRVKTIARLVDRMLVVFPFEEGFYRGANVPCTFVGHPLLDVPEDTRGRAELAAAFGLDAERPILGLLPGSRKKEISFLLPVMVESYKLLKDKVPGLQAVLPIADTLDAALIAPYVAGTDIRTVRGDTEGVMRLMDAAVVASGTATLQTALHGKPMVIIYKLSPLTYQIGRRLIKLKNVGLANIVAGEEVVPELIQDAASPENITSLISRMFCDRAYYSEVAGKLARVRERLGGPGASARAAREISRLLDKKTGD